MTTQDTVIVSGSHGVLIVHRETGFIVRRELDGDEYATISHFDPVPFARLGGTWFDILATGYWTIEGHYADPLTIRTSSHRGREVFNDWVGMACLPAPSHFH